MVENKKGAPLAEATPNQKVHSKDNVLFHYYEGNIEIPSAKGEININTLLKAIKHPKPELLELINKIRLTDIKADRDKLKRQLYFFIPCCVTDGKHRGYKNIQHFTGWLLLDFDGIESTELAKEFKEHIFNEYSFIMSAWLSSSGLGVRAFVKIPTVTNVDDFKAFYWGLVNTHMSEYGTGNKPWCDDSMQKPTQPLFYSYDADILIRSNYSTWSIKGLNPKRQPRPTTPKMIRINHAYSGKYAIVNAVKGIDKIVDNGHPQVLSASFALGGHVANGKVSFSESETALHRAIEQNNYLSKGLEGYKKSATDALTAGLNAPHNEQ